MSNRQLIDALCEIVGTFDKTKLFPRVRTLDLIARDALLADNNRDYKRIVQRLKDWCEEAEF